MTRRRIVRPVIDRPLDPHRREAAARSLAEWRAEWSDVPEAAWALAEIDELGDGAVRIADALIGDVLGKRALTTRGTVAVLLVAVFDHQLGARAVEMLRDTRNRRAGGMLLAGLERLQSEVPMHGSSVAELALGCLSEWIDKTATVYPGADPRTVRATAEHPVLDAETTARTIALFDHALPRVREIVANAFALHESSQARYEDVYLAVLSRNADSAMERALCSMIVARRDRATRDALRAMLPRARRASDVLRALAAIGEIEPAVAAIESGADESAAILTAVGDFGGRRGRDLLLHVLEDESRDLALRESALVWFSERRQESIYRRWDARLAELRRAREQRAPAHPPRDGDSLPEHCFRVFRHPSGREWRIALAGSVVHLRIVATDGEVVERARKLGSWKDAAAEHDQLVRDQLADEFVEVVVDSNRVP